MTKRAIFLDRDGVINRALVRDGIPHPPSSIPDLELLPGVADACHRLERAGWLLFVVTNQPDIARGTATRDDVDTINAAATAGLPVVEVLTCPHDDSDACACRKPEPGMLLDAAARWDVDLSDSVMIGDRWRDVEAGRRAGTRTILVGDGYGEHLPHAPGHIVNSLSEAADLIVGGEVAEQDIDDWESHWAEYSDSASDNPAQGYRRELILALIQQGAAPARILDIGSGQGDLVAALRDHFPSATITGLELSAEGIRRAREKVPAAQFVQVDLVRSDPPPALSAWADIAVCSEVLEHVDDPVVLLRAACRCLAPGGRLIVTVPGGPRTAFDRFIGHRQHFTSKSLRSVLERADLHVERVTAAGFPFFNLYKLVVLVRGKALVRDASISTSPSRLATAAMRGFRVVLRPRFNATHFGWQLTAIARATH